MRKTVHLDAGRAADVAEAARLLGQGRLVAFATETVYGLGANALSTSAVAGIFAAKQRPAWDPLIVHLASVEQIGEITEVPAHLASRITQLAEAFWPGPLTLLLPRSSAIPDAVTAGRPLVGVRVPAHPAAHALLAACGLPIAAPSANRFGHTSPTTAAHVLADLDGRIDAVLDAGPAAIGVESTVLDPTQTPMVLYRPGAITAEQLTRATGVAVHVYEPQPAAREPQPAAREPRIEAPETGPEALPSPGVGLRHYAPRARLVLVEVSAAEDLEHCLLAQCRALSEAGQRVGTMLPEGWAALPGCAAYSWGRWDDAETLAARLFAGLRELDERGVDAIVCPLPQAGGLREAIRDRLRKAARV